MNRPQDPAVAKKSKTPYTATTNACKLCTPLGASLAFKGIEGAVPFLHGSQGCATYMRRYLISHFREPADIASSSLGEKHAVYGGGPNLQMGLRNVIQKYEPQLIGVATTCLTETIGDDVPMFLRQFEREWREDTGAPPPAVVQVSTPSYSGTHADGFHAAVRAVAEQLTDAGEDVSCDPLQINVLPGMVSPADIRYMKEILEDFGLKGVVLPDISETLDGPALEDYEKLPAGGTPLADIRAMGRSAATIECGWTLVGAKSAGGVLEKRFGTPLHRMGLPMGLRQTDCFFEALAKVSGREAPERHVRERGRLVDAYVDGHKYIFGKRAVVYGEEDLVVGLCSFLAEVGVRPVLCASGGRSARFKESVEAVTGEVLPEAPLVREGVDFYEIAGLVKELGPDLIIGNSKGYRMAREQGVPLIRVGFPVHDRFGAQRLLHVGYRGAQELLDRVVNTVLEKKQEESPVGYGYL